jgi:hypothetical protein
MHQLKELYSYQTYYRVSVSILLIPLAICSLSFLKLRYKTVGVCSENLHSVSNKPSGITNYQGS